MSAERLILVPLLFAGMVAQAATFRFTSIDDKSCGLWEGEKPVFVYNHGVMLKEGVPADRARSSYVHPLYGLDGEVLTDDFPKDHYHHRGLFWSWPHVTIDGKDYDLWMLKGIRHEFDQWEQEAKSRRAVLKVQNYWVADGCRVMKEVAEFTVFPATKDARAIDVKFTWTPLKQPITLAGAEGKSYGGLTLRFAPRTDTVITTPLGIDEKDLPMTRLPWADLTAAYPGVGRPSGAAIFISPKHPDFPPMWLTRHYGVLCVGWPGVEAQTFPAGRDIVCSYRVLVHRNLLGKDQLQKFYDTYSRAQKK
ncbi:MAG TPA: PmoA family protein [Candidatus Paceibacterota bacterium]|nr:PmoA family protein [Verrucomicrobiota bacterium]HSA09381.1 PmoA family protein [Candidatus Paceibacterota bacterium]